MTHLILCREYPPAAYPAGGIVTYVETIARQLAARGETVHVIAQRWPGAPRALERQAGGRLIVHRVPLDEALHDAGAFADREADLVRRLHRSGLPSRAFQWQAARLAESLVEAEGIDLIEAQEYEAPAYLLQFRRALGLGPGRRVPILIHLHSPTEFILRANGWDLARPNRAMQIQLETYTIQAADGWLCPSRFLARAAEERYQLPAGSVNVIPLPLEETRLLTRAEATWREGTICCVGRLEPRKGIAEWIEAAGAVAVEQSQPRFTMIGADLPTSDGGHDSTRARLRARIPAAARGRFQFLDALPRRDLATHLAAARIAAVPSRWDNFPYTCIEAMASGLPVLASPCGGMVEVIEDGRTGWIADGGDAKSLGRALRRALATPPGRLAEMGTEAAASIRADCSPEPIASRHVELRRQIAGRGVTESSLAPARASTEAWWVVAYPDLSASSAPRLEAASGNERRLAMADVMAAQGARVLGPMEVLRATPELRAAIVRKALADPLYVMRWIAWHLLRVIRR